MDGIVGHPAGEKSFHAKILGLERLPRDCISETYQLNKFKVFQIFGFRAHQMPYHGARLSHSCTEKNTHPRPDFINHYFGGNDRRIPAVGSYFLHRSLVGYGSKLIFVCNDLF
jgi:hypothetical protein